MSARNVTVQFYRFIADELGNKDGEADGSELYSGYIMFSYFDRNSGGTNKEVKQAVNILKTPAKIEEDW